MITKHIKSYFYYFRNYTFLTNFLKKVNTMFISRTNEPVENFATPPAGIAEVDLFIQ